MKGIDITLPAGALRVIENDIEKPYEGGRIVLTADNGEQAKSPSNKRGDLLREDMKITQVTVMINYALDEAMADWPATRAEIEGRRFNLHLTEEPMEHLPAGAPANG